MPRSSNGNPDYITCLTHQKRGYMSKREAERAVRMYHPGEHMDVYECTNGTGLWHAGHLPDVVVRRGVDRKQATVRRRPR